MKAPCVRRPICWCSVLLLGVAGAACGQSTDSDVAAFVAPSAHAHTQATGTTPPTSTPPSAKPGSPTAASLPLCGAPAPAAVNVPPSKHDELGAILAEDPRGRRDDTGGPAVLRSPRDEATRSPDACARVSRERLLASARWKPGLSVQVSGAHAQAQGDYEVLHTDLHLVSAPQGCILASVELGQTTLERASAPRGPRRQHELRIAALGTAGNENEIVALERADLYDGSYVLVARWIRDAAWGRSEYDARVISVRGRELIGGDRLPVGRSALNGPSYVGSFQMAAQNGRRMLTLSLEGIGCKTAVRHFEPDERSVFRGDALAEASNVRLTQNEGASGTLHVPFEDAASPKASLRGCGHGEALFILRDTPCSDGTQASVERQPDSTIDVGGFALERYLVTCGESDRRVQKLLFAHPKLCSQSRTSRPRHAEHLSGRRGVQ
jgi:hypothetical protein